MKSQRITHLGIPAIRLEEPYVLWQYRDTLSPELGYEFKLIPED